MREELTMHRAFAALLRRELLIEASYRFALLLQAGGAAFTILIFYFVARLFDPASPHPLVARYGSDYFGFVLVGLALSPLAGGGLVATAGRFRREQVEGTLEYLFATELSPVRLAAGFIALDLARAAASLALHLAAGAWLFGLAFHPNLPQLAGLLALAFAIAGAFGLLSAAFVIRFQRGDPLTAGLSLLQEFLSGVYFPPELLGPALGTASALLPATHALGGIRKALFLGPAAAAGPELAALALFAALLVPLSVGSFDRAVRFAKRKGALSVY